MSPGSEYLHLIFCDTLVGGGVLQLVMFATQLFVQFQRLSVVIQRYKFNYDRQ